jgi:Rieske Fe-S protein
MKRLLKYIYVVFFNAMILLSCSDQVIEDGIPQVIVNETINLKNYQYQPLAFIGGYVYLNAGVRGIIIYRQSVDEYIAIERNCTFQPLDPCAIVSVDQSTLFLIDTCCTSTFDFNGFPTGGPATLPLRQYNTFLNQNYLTISNGF